MFVLAKDSSADSGNKQFQNNNAFVFSEKTVAEQLYGKCKRQLRMQKQYVANAKDSSSLEEEQQMHFFPQHIPLGCQVEYGRLRQMFWLRQS